jgi:hypothetical protein
MQARALVGPVSPYSRRLILTSKETEIQRKQNEEIETAADIMQEIKELRITAG